MIENEPVYREPQKPRRIRRSIKIRHNPRWDKTLKHIKGLRRQGLI